MNKLKTMLSDRLFWLASIVGIALAFTMFLFLTPTHAHSDEGSAKSSPLLAR